MTTENLNVVRNLQEAMDRLPDSKREYLIGYAEGVLAMSQAAAEQRTPAAAPPQNSA